MLINLFKSKMGYPTINYLENQLKYFIFLLQKIGENTKKGKKGSLE